jgi:hypothetical protein
MKEWGNYIYSLRISKKLEYYTFLKQPSVFISKGKIESESYVAHKDILSGLILIKVDSRKEAIEVSKNCPVFKRNGSIEIKEIDEKYNTLNNESSNIS